MAKNIQLAVLVYVVNKKQLLLAKKARKVNAGTWTSYGGKFEKGETELACCVRELQQESGLVVKEKDLHKVGIIDFHNSEGDVWRVHTYFVSKYFGTPISTSEMTSPKWFDISKLPFKNMPWSDQYWLPLLLDGKKLRVVVHKDPLKVVMTELASI